ncbi:MAG: hypothetical protein WDO69_24785 [Pseudomonadota bacterium]
MNEASRLLLLSIAFIACACASGNARQPALAASEHTLAAPTKRAASRLGPPSPRGMGLRRVDRPIAAEPPLALY